MKTHYLLSVKREFKFILVIIFLLNIPILNYAQEAECCDGTFNVIIKHNDDVAAVGANILINQNVRIEGDFIVNASFTFQNCNITCCPGANIIVDAGIDIVLAGTTSTTGGNDFHGCTNMWKGITLKAAAGLNNGAGLKIISGLNKIRDAEYGIDAINLNLLEITSPLPTLFDANYVGIRANNTSKVKLGAVEFNSTYNCLPAYSSQTSIPGSKSYCGMFLTNDVNWDFALYAGTKIFRNINLGIEAYNCNINISGNAPYRASFDNISRSTPYANNGISGSAIYAASLTGLFGSLKYNGLGSVLNIPEIEDCDRAIRTVDINVSLSNIYADAVTNGFIIEGGAVNNKTIDIKYCKLNSKKNGVQLLRNDPSRHILLEGNLIDFGTNSFPSGVFSGILVSESLNANPDCKIGDDNTITFNANNNTRARYGIRLVNAANWLVVNNRILIDDNDSPKYGISTEGTSFANINCNDIECIDCPNNLSAFNQTQNHVGIYNIQGSDLKLSCNSTDYTSYGISNKGPIAGITLIETNTMNNHHHGLFLQNGSSITQQNRTGNQWTTAPIGVNGKQAKCASLANPSSNRFFVDNSQNCGDMPSPLQPTSGFFYGSTGPNTCCSTNYCGIPDFVNDAIDSLDLVLISNELSFPEYENEILWMMRFNLWNRLDINLTLRESLDELQTFYSEFEETNIAKFNLIRTHKLSSYYFNLDYIDILDSISDEIALTDNMVQELINELHTNTTLTGSQISEIQEEVHELYLSNYINLTNNYNLLIPDFLTEKSGYIDQYSDFCNSITTTNSIEENQKNVDQIFFETISNGSTQFSVEQNDILVAIANQCPMEGGNAVFQAIAMLLMNDPELEVDYDANCGTIQAEQRLHNSILSNTSNFEISVGPIPTKDYIQFKTSYTLNNVNLLIYDGRGKLIDSKEMEELTTGYQISLANYPSGMYFYRIQSIIDQQNIAQGKFSLLK